MDEGAVVGEVGGRRAGRDGRLGDALRRACRGRSCARRRRTAASSPCRRVRPHRLHVALHLHGRAPLVAVAHQHAHLACRRRSGRGTGGRSRDRRRARPEPAPRADHRIGEARVSPPSAPPSRRGCVPARRSAPDRCRCARSAPSRRPARRRRWRRTRYCVWLATVEPMPRAPNGSSTKAAMPMPFRVSACARLRGRDAQAAGRDDDQRHGLLAGLRRRQEQLAVDGHARHVRRPADGLVVVDRIGRGDVEVARPTLPLANTTSRSRKRAGAACWVMRCSCRARRRSRQACSP